jgi:hypothetical protein
MARYGDWAQGQVINWRTDWMAERLRWRISSSGGEGS